LAAEVIEHVVVADAGGAVVERGAELAACRTGSAEVVRDTHVIGESAVANREQHHIGVENDGIGVI